MALARVKTWIAGDVLTAADLNGEFNNVINNPVALISPSTGVIDFNLQAHKNLIPGAISASSGTAGQALTVSTAATPTAIWAAPTAPIASFSGLTSGQLIIGASSGGGTALSIGSTGQVLSVTSSNTNPVWGVIPLSGGLTSGAPVSGNIFYVSTSGVLTPLAIGTSAQVLTVSSGLPVWAAAAAGSGSVLDPEANVLFTEDFWSFTTGQTAYVQSDHQWSYNSTEMFTTAYSNNLKGIVNVVATGTLTAPAIMSQTSFGTPLTPQFSSTFKPTLKVRWQQATTQAFTNFQQVGLVDGSPLAAITNGIFFQSTAPSATVYGIVRNASVQSTLSMGVTATAMHNYQAIVSASSTVQFLVDGVSQGTLNTSNVPAGVALALAAGSNNNAGVNQGLLIDYMQVQSTR